MSYLNKNIETTTIISYKLRVVFYKL